MYFILHKKKNSLQVSWLGRSSRSPLPDPKEHNIIISITYLPFIYFLKYKDSRWCEICKNFTLAGNLALLTLKLFHRDLILAEKISQKTQRSRPVMTTVATSPTPTPSWLAV